MDNNESVEKEDKLDSLFDELTGAVNSELEPANDEPATTEEQVTDTTNEQVTDTTEEQVTDTTNEQVTDTTNEQVTAKPVIDENQLNTQKERDYYKSLVDNLDALVKNNPAELLKQLNIDPYDLITSNANKEEALPKNEFLQLKQELAKERQLAALERQKANLERIVATKPNQWKILSSEMNDTMANEVLETFHYAQQQNPSVTIEECVDAVEKVYSDRYKKAYDKYTSLFAPQNPVVNEPAKQVPTPMPSPVVPDTSKMTEDQRRDFLFDKYFGD